MKHKEIDFIEWYCDHCGCYMNNQEGFTRKEGTWICEKCGFENDVTNNNVIDNPVGISEEIIFEVINVYKDVIVFEYQGICGEAGINQEDFYYIEWNGIKKHYKTIKDLVNDNFIDNLTIIQMINEIDRVEA